MKEIIRNTPITVEEVKRWRDLNPNMLPMTAKYNARVSILIDELTAIQSEVDDPNEKINRLIDILIRGIEFKE